MVSNLYRCKIYNSDRGCRVASKPPCHRQSARATFGLHPAGHARPNRKSLRHAGKLVYGQQGTWAYERHRTHSVTNTKSGAAAIKPTAAPMQSSVRFRRQ